MRVLEQLYARARGWNCIVRNCLGRFNMGKNLDMTAYILWIAAIVLGAISLVLLLNGHRTQALWIGCFCLMSATLAITFVLHESISLSQIDSARGNTGQRGDADQESNRKLNEPGPPSIGHGENAAAPNPGTPDEDSKTPGKDDQKQDRFHWVNPVTIATIIMSIATCFLAIFSLLQTRVVQHTANRQLRAYVIYQKSDGIDLENTVQNFRVVIKNSGQTPAYDVTHKAAYILRVDNPTQEFIEKIARELIAKAPGSICVLGGGEQLTLPSAPGFTLTPEQLAGIRSGTIVVYLVGEIRYVDIFGDSHLTTYCLVQGGNIDSRGLVTAPFGNFSN